MGPAWVRLGPGLGPAWPTLGPAWARLGPTLGRLGSLGSAGGPCQTPPQAPPPDELSDPNLTPLPTYPGIKYVARALAAIIAGILISKHYLCCDEPLLNAHVPAGLLQCSILCIASQVAETAIALYLLHFKTLELIWQESHSHPLHDSF